MKEFIEKILEEYVPSKEESFTGHPMGTYFRKTIPEEIYATGIVDENEYLVSGTTGKGGWATVPMICIMDRSITTSPSHGVYIVYLLEKNGNSLYLTFNQGCTDLQANTRNKRKTIQIMRENAASIISSIDSRGFLTDENINLGKGSSELPELYQRGTIFYKEYKKGAVPEEDELRNDLKKMMDIYREYAGKGIVHTTGEFGSWEILNETTAIKKCDSDFFDGYRSDIPGDILWFFDAESLQPNEAKQITLEYSGELYNGLISCNASDNEKVVLSWEKSLGLRLIAFHNFEQTTATFTKESPTRYRFEINYARKKREPVTAISIKETIEQIEEYIANKGFAYNDKLIENFYLSLKSKPFVILAGTSGTGKTRLVKLFSEAISAEYRLVSVRPDWSDGSDLFGHFDLNGNFIDGPACACFKLAYENPNTPVFLCVDEMNLARVEYYLSDFLSIIESREKNGDGIFTAPIAQYEQGIPDNLYIVGTVNMDETTFPFSKKVLDRANTIEFNYVDLMPSFVLSSAEPQSQVLSNDFLRTKYLVLSKDCIEEQEYVCEICAELQAINDILRKANAHIGYRVRDEIVFYLLNNKNDGYLLSHEEALDNEIMQKILPRIQGSSAPVRDMLCDLFKLCASDHDQKAGNTDSEKMRRILEDSSVSCRYRKSAEKIELMVRRFEDDGFTSFWL